MVFSDTRNHYGSDNGMQSVTPYTILHRMSLCSELEVAFHRVRRCGLRTNISLLLPNVQKLKIVALDLHRKYLPPAPSFRTLSHCCNGVLHRRSESYSTNIWAISVGKKCRQAVELNFIPFVDLTVFGLHMYVFSFSFSCHFLGQKRW